MDRTGVLIGAVASVIIICIVEFGGVSFKSEEPNHTTAAISHREMYRVLKPLLTYKELVAKPDIVNLVPINGKMKTYDYTKDLDKIVSSLRFESITREVERIYSLPANTLMTLIIIESGGDIYATNEESTATGLFQITKGTGRLYGLSVNRELDERLNPLLSADCVGRMFAYSLSQNPSMEKAFTSFRGISGSKEWEMFQFYMEVLNDKSFMKNIEEKFNKSNKNLIVNHVKPKHGHRYKDYMEAYRKSWDNYGLHKYKTLSTLLWQGKENYGALTTKEEHIVPLFLFYKVKMQCEIMIWQKIPSEIEIVGYFLLLKVLAVVLLEKSEVF